MPDPAVIQGTGSESPATQRTVTFTLGSAPALNDVIVMLCSSGTTAAFALPGDWENLLGGTSDAETPVHQAMLLAHVVTAGETSQTVWTLTDLYNAAENWQTAVVVLRNVNVADIFDVYAHGFSDTAVSNIVAPAHTPGVTGGLSLFAAARDGSLQRFDSSPPGGWSIQAQCPSTSAATFIASRTTLSTSGVSVPSVTFTPNSASNDEWLGWSFTVNPSSGWSGSFVKKADNVKARVRMHNAAAASVRLASGARL